MNTETVAHHTTEPQSLRKQIDQLATDIQHRASQAVTMNDLAADILSDMGGQATVRDINNLVNLVDLALRAARELADLGEQVERLVHRIPAEVTA